jgi:hypothetical protein
MSRYAWLACSTCRKLLWLGKVVERREGGISHFHIGDAQNPRNAERPELNRALWKLLAECGVHGVRVITDVDPDYGDLDQYVEIGGDEVGDIDFQTYLRDWPG